MISSGQRLSSPMEISASSAIIRAWFVVVLLPILTVESLHTRRSNFIESAVFISMSDCPWLNQMSTFPWSFLGGNLYLVISIFPETSQYLQANNTLGFFRAYHSSFIGLVA